MPSSSITKQVEEILEEVLRTIRKEYESPFPVLCESDRNSFVEEEGSLREQLKQTIEPESNSWRALFCLPSPQAVKCLKEAEELRQRVKENINTKLRTRLSGKSNPLLNPAFNFKTGAKPEVPEVNVHPAVQNDHDYTSDTNGAINSPHETSSESGDRSRDSSSRRHRGSSPPPRRMYQSGNSRFLSDTSSDSDSDTPRRSHSVRRPPQSPRQSRTPRSPVNVSFPSPGTLRPDPTSISRLARAQGRQRLRCSDDYVTRTNCADINDSNVIGLTMTNGGTNNSGAVIHETVVPHQRLPRHVPQF